MSQKLGRNAIFLVTAFMLNSVSAAPEPNPSCSVPQTVGMPTCREGSVIEHGKTCKPQCAKGFEVHMIIGSKVHDGSHAILCRDGHFYGPRGHRSASFTCTEIVRKLNGGNTHVRGSVIVAGTAQVEIAKADACSTIHCHEVGYELDCKQHQHCCWWSSSKEKCNERRPGSFHIWMWILIVLCIGAVVFIVWMLVCKTKKQGVRGGLFEGGASVSVEASTSASLVASGAMQTKRTFSSLATPVPVVQAVAVKD